MTDPANRPLTIDELERAAAAIEGHAVVTPVASSPALDRRLGVSVHCKVEAEQRAGAFKFRGAYHRLSAIPVADRAAGAVAVSSGNHGAAVATAGRMLGMPATVFVPVDAPETKRRIIAEAGAELVTFPRDIADREAPARARAAETGATFVHPFEDRLIQAGQGTVGLELHAQVGALTSVLVPMSGGGLMAGVASATAAVRPDCRLVGVEPAAADNTRRSFAAGHPIQIDPPDTIADGLAVVRPGDTTFAINRTLVSEVSTVTETEIMQAVALIHETLGVVVEPSGAVGIALLASVRAADGPEAVVERFGSRVGVVLSGGNVDPDRHRQMIERGSGPAATKAKGE